jgi:hypothetical protein
LVAAVQLLVTALAVGLAGGCRSEAPGAADGGVDASSGVAGSGGAGGTGGVGGAGGMSSVPSCLRDLIAACPADGACRSNATDGGPATLYCYAGGVQGHVTMTGSCVGDFHLVLQVRRPDGSPCYTYEDARGYMCESDSITWIDPSGTIVATASDTVTGTTVRCAASGETLNCASSVSNPCTFGPIFANVNCDPGACP